MKRKYGVRQRNGKWKEAVQLPLALMEIAQAGRESLEVLGAELRLGGRCFLDCFMVDKNVNTAEGQESGR